MIGILTSIGNIISTLVNFIINFFVSLYYLFVNLPGYLSFLVASINVLPAVIIPFAVASIFIYVIYLILGR